MRARFALSCLSSLSPRLTTFVGDFWVWVLPSTGCQGGWLALLPTFEAWPAAPRLACARARSSGLAAACFAAAAAAAAAALRPQHKAHRTTHYAPHHQPSSCANNACAQQMFEVDEEVANESAMIKHMIEGELRGGRRRRREKGGARRAAQSRRCCGEPPQAGRGRSVFDEGAPTFSESLTLTRTHCTQHHHHHHARITQTRAPTR